MNKQEDREVLRPEHRGIKPEPELQESLQEDGRTANVEVRKFDSGPEYAVFVLQHAYGGEDRSAVTGTDCRSHRMCHRANRAGRGLGLAGVIVGGLGRHCPQQQGHGEPRRPAYQPTHKFPSLQFRLYEAYNGYPTQRNIAQVTIWTWGIRASLWSPSISEREAIYGRTQL
jgi:hypothetical protein